MHVMFIPSWYSNNRNKVHGSFFKEQALALQESGIKITIAYNEIWPLTELGKIKEHHGLFIEVEDGLNTYRYKNYNFLPKNSKMFYIFNKRMKKLYKEIIRREGKVDVIHAQSSLWGGISASYISEKYNIPLVITEHSSIKNAKYIKKSYLPFVLQSYKNADKLIAVGNGLKNELEEFSGRQDVEVVYNITDFTLFNIKKVNKEKGFSFFSLAFLEGEKGFDILINAFSRGFKDIDDVYLYIGGDGSQRSSLQRLCIDLNIEDKVIFLGALTREEVVLWMNKCNAFVLPSRYETFGMVYLEALACGKPVIATYNGGAEEMINENNGYMVPKDNVNELVKGMKYIYDNINLYNGENIRKMSIEKFGSDNSIKRIINMYDEIINRSVE